VFALGLGIVAAAQQAPRSPDVGFAATAPAVVDAMLELAGIKAEDVVYDLGSGDGRVVILAARKYGARGVGIEIDPRLVKISREAAVTSGVADKVSFVEGDLFAADISPASVVTLFLWPSVNARLEAKLRQELRPGTRIVSNSFGIGNWRPDRTARAADGSPILLWEVPRAPSRRPDVPFASTPEPVVYEMLALAGATGDDVVYDLGSGDGRVAILAAQKYGARAVGIEIDPRLVEIAKEVARDALLLDRVTFVEGDLLTADIAPATLVFLFLSEEINATLAPRLRRDLRPGARVVSRQFAIAGWTPDKIVTASDGSRLFLWTIPGR